ncbi:hypothetical protein LCGC14_1162460, partial [marine sediment metagenome]
MGVLDSYWMKSLKDLLVDKVERQKLVVIDWEHHQIHHSEMYSVTHHD